MERGFFELAVARRSEEVAHVEAKNRIIWRVGKRQE
jgi:hypothetical protein